MIMKIPQRGASTRGYKDASLVASAIVAFMGQRERWAGENRLSWREGNRETRNKHGIIWAKSRARTSLAARSSPLKRLTSPPNSRTIFLLARFPTRRRAWTWKPHIWRIIVNEPVVRERTWRNNAGCYIRHFPIRATVLIFWFHRSDVARFFSSFMIYILD